MADDQTNNSSQLTVDSEQKNSTAHRKPSTANREPFYQDELDVLEAVLKLEKKYGKKFLTEEQRGMLTKARGSILTEKPINLRDTNKVIDMILMTVRAVIEKTLIEGLGYCSWADWDKKSDELRAAILNFHTTLFLGKSEDEIRKSLSERLGAKT